MDKLLNKETFQHINKSLNELQYKNLRILCVFGGYGLNRSMIYVTEEDEVYGTGDNKDGCLGLGTTGPFVYWPTVNKTLSNKQLVDIIYGYSSCVGLTRDGKCYSWGSNKFGQLGNGFIVDSDFSPTPQLIKRLSDKRVVQISCGNAHVLALTDSGQVYAWGRNSMGECGNRTWTNTYWPTLIPFYGKVVSVSCGKSHSIALMANGLVYIWGNNKFGQLGQKTIRRPERGIYRSSNRPELIDTISIHVIKKVVCGPNHSLLLTSKGDIYSFGLNDCGQVGNGAQDDQHFPIKINDKTKFKDIFASFHSQISIGLSVKNKYLIWGFCDYQKILRPQEVPTTENQTIFKIYTIYAEYKITYRAIVNINEEKQSIDSIGDTKTDLSEDMESNDSNFFGSDTSSVVSFQTDVFEDSNSPQNSSLNRNMNKESDILYNDLCETLDNSPNNIILFGINDQYIYGHKDLLEVRNKKFWLKCKQLLNEENNEIRVNDYSYKCFYAVIQYLYTNKVHIDCENAIELLSFANSYGEQQLKDKCLQFMSNIIDLTNVCEFYTKAIEKKIQELEKFCLEFVANNFIHCLSQDLQQMEEKLSTNLLLSSLEMTREYQCFNNSSEKINDRII